MIKFLYNLLFAIFLPALLIAQKKFYQQHSLEIIVAKKKEVGLATVSKAKENHLALLWKKDYPSRVSLLFNLSYNRGT